MIVRRILSSQKKFVQKMEKRRNGISSGDSKSSTRSTIASSSASTAAVLQDLDEFESMLQLTETVSFWEDIDKGKHIIIIHITYLFLLPDDSNPTVHHRRR